MTTTARRRLEAKAARASPSPTPVRGADTEDGNDDETDSDSDTDVDDDESDAVKYSVERLYAIQSYSVADPTTAKIARRLRSFVGTLDTRNRRFIRDGEVDRQGRFSVVHRQMFLFTDRLLLTKPESGGKLRLKQQADLDGLHLDIRPLFEQRTECRDTKLTRPFRVCFTKPKPGAWILHCDKDEDRAEWIRAIALAASRIRYTAAKERNEKLEWGWYLKFVVGSIHLAALNGDEASVRAIIERDATVSNTRGQEGRTPLHVAAFTNHSAIIQLLLDKGADVEMCDPNGRTALHITAMLGYEKSTEILLNHSQLKPSLYHTITKAASTKQNLNATSAIWQCAFARNGEYEKCLRMLVKHCIDHSNSAVTAAQVLDLRSVDGLSLLDAAVVLGLGDVLPVLVTLGCTIDLESKEGCTPLGAAAQHCEMETLTTLIQLGAQVNWRDATYLNSPLHFAGSLEVASFLAANGARISIRNREGVRVTDIYATNSAVNTLSNAESLYQSRAPVEINEDVHAKPRSTEENGGHSLDSCYVCQESLAGIGSIGRKREWCRSCGLCMCQSCLNQFAIFVHPNDNSELRARVCAGCFNRALYAPETKEKKKKRLARQRQAAAEAANSIFTLEGMMAAITAVQVTPNMHEQQYQTPIPIPAAAVPAEPISSNEGSPAQAQSAHIKRATRRQPSIGTHVGFDRTVSLAVVAGNDSTGGKSSARSSTGMKPSRSVDQITEQRRSARPVAKKRVAAAAGTNDSDDEDNTVNNNNNQRSPANNRPAQRHTNTRAIPAKNTSPLASDAEDESGDASDR